MAPLPATILAGLFGAAVVLAVALDFVKLALHCRLAIAWVWAAGNYESASRNLWGPPGVLLLKPRGDRIARQSKGNHMFKRATALSMAALAGCAALALSTSPTLAFPVASPAIAQAAPQVENVYWRHRGWGGPGLLFGGLAAAAIVGGGYYGGYGPGYYGRPYYGYGPGPGACWRNRWGQLRCS